MSQQIQKLEQELGERLFTRLKRQAVPTAAGTRFWRTRCGFWRTWTTAEREVKDADGKLRSVVNLGVLPTIAPLSAAPGAPVMPGHAIRI